MFVLFNDFLCKDIATSTARQSHLYGIFIPCLWYAPSDWHLHSKLMVEILQDVFHFTRLSVLLGA